VATVAPSRFRRTTLAAAAILAALVLAPPAAAAGLSYTDADYLAFADRIVAQLDPTWNARAGYYVTTAPGLESRYNAALLTVFATAAATGHVGPARNDERARELADRLTQSPPFSTAAAPPWADPMFHTPGWVGAMSGGYDIMDKAIDPKIAEGLTAAWSARAALGLPDAVAGRIAAEINGVAYSPFFRFPSVRLNQINWPAEMYAYDATVTGSAELLVTDYRRQIRRFVAGIRRPWTGSRRTGATNLSPTFRFHYQVNEPEGARRNIDSAEYANMTLHFLSFYDQALVAGMKPLRETDARLLRAWVTRDLLGYWMHSGFMNWDSGLGYRRWMKSKTWAYALQGLLTIARATAFQDDPRYGPWAKEMFDRALDFYERQAPPDGLAGSAMFGVDPNSRSVPDSRMLAARMAANAARAVTAGLGRMTGVEPPPFYSFDPDIGRLAVSTPRYGTAVLVVNRNAFPYGGIELARLFDGAGDPIATVGAHAPAAFGVAISDARGRHVFDSEVGLHASPRLPPLRVLTPQGLVTRSPRSPKRPFAGTFRTLEATATRQTRDLRITTRHRFDAESITESWLVRRLAGRRRYSVAVQFPSWGTGASIDAELADGRIVALAIAGRPAGAVAVKGVKRFRIASARGGYWVTPLRRADGIATAIAVAPQRSAPVPGPTLRLTIRRASRFASAALEARITPFRAGPG
jgi:hypothetical protein